MSATDSTPAPPPPEPRRRVPVWVFVIVGVVALCCVGGLVASVTTFVVARRHSDAGRLPPASRASLGQPVRDGKFEFTVGRVQCGYRTVGQDFYTKEATGQYCLATMTVKNVGRSPQAFSDVEQLAFSPDGKEYRADPEAGAYVNDLTAFNTDINPGNQIDAIVAYDIPASSSIAKLRLHDDRLSRGAEVSVT
jgi:hypothetical protein